MALLIVVAFALLILFARIEGRRIARERAHDGGIDAFVAHFAANGIRPIVAFTVYRELVGYAGFPLRPDDRIQALHVDDDDWDDFLLEEMVLASGARKFIAPSGVVPVHTVADLVAFVERLSASRSQPS